MKLLFFLLILANSAAAEIRLINGKPVDLTAALAAGPSSSYSNYWIKGKVVLNYPNTLFLSYDAGIRYFLRPVDRREMHEMSNQELASLMSAARLAGYTNGVPEDVFRNFPMSSFAVSFFEPKHVLTSIAILNHNSTKRDGEFVCILALPIPRKTFALSSSTVTPLCCYDAGTPYDLANNTNKFLQVLTPYGLKEVQFKTNLVTKPIGGTNESNRGTPQAFDSIGNVK